MGCWGLSIFDKVRFFKVEKIGKTRLSDFLKNDLFFILEFSRIFQVLSVLLIRIKYGLSSSTMLKSSVGERFRSSSNIGNGHCPEASELVRKEQQSWYQEGCSRQGYNPAGESPVVPIA